MSNVLVCIKRVPDVSGEVLLTDDEQSVDARHVGFTVSPHEECAVELATQVAEATRRHGHRADARAAPRRSSSCAARSPSAARTAC